MNFEVGSGHEWRIWLGRD